MSVCYKNARGRGGEGQKGLAFLFGGLQVHAMSHVALPVHTLVLPVSNCRTAEVREMDHRCERDSLPFNCPLGRELFC